MNSIKWPMRVTVVKVLFHLFLQKIESHLVQHVAEPV